MTRPRGTDLRAVRGERRLRRRLDREIRIRRKAEEIAEDGLRDLYRKQRELEFLSQITIMANLGGSPQEVLRSALEYMCRFTGWSAAHAYIVAGEEPRSGCGRRTSGTAHPNWTCPSSKPPRLVMFSAKARDCPAGSGPGVPGLGRRLMKSDSSPAARPRWPRPARRVQRAAADRARTWWPRWSSSVPTRCRRTPADARDPAGRRPARPGDRARSRQRPAARLRCTTR